MVKDCLGREVTPIIAKIKKSDLVDGGYYAGKCRNASVARWSAEQQKFWHWRTKWQQKFTESIFHPEDDNGYDLFEPDRLLEPHEVLEEIPLHE